MQSVLLSIKAALFSINLTAILIVGLVGIVVLTMVITFVEQRVVDAAVAERQSARDLEVLPAKSLIILLKYVLSGSRSVTEDEKIRIAWTVNKVFPGKLTLVEICLLVEAATPNPDHLQAYVAPFMNLSEDGRQRVFEVVASMADEKSMGSDVDHVAAIRAALDLNPS